MRDLGLDHQAARRRRIPVMKQRLTKASNRKIKLRVLKIPALKVRLRLHRGGIQPVALWGIEGQGLAPRYRTALRQAMAKHLGHRNGGPLDITYDLHSKRYIDPGDQIIIHHIKAIHQLVQAWPTEQYIPAAPDQAVSMVHSPRPHCRRHRVPSRMGMAGFRAHEMDPAGIAATSGKRDHPSTPMVED